MLILVVYAFLTAPAIFFASALWGRFWTARSINVSERRATNNAVVLRIAEVVVAGLALWILWGPILHTTGATSGFIAKAVAVLYTLLIGGTYIIGSLFALVTIPLGSQSVYFESRKVKIENIEQKPLIHRAGRTESPRVRVERFSLEPREGRCEPKRLALGPDGRVWFTDYGADRVGSISARGDVRFIELEREIGPCAISVGPDHAMWVTTLKGNTIIRIAPHGDIEQFVLPTPNSVPRNLALGPDGRMWFALQTGSIGAIDMEGRITEYRDGLDPESHYSGICAGDDGKMWFSAHRFLRYGFGSITTSGEVRNINSDPAAATYLYCDANSKSLWYAGYNSNSVGKLSYQGRVTDYRIPVPERLADKAFGYNAGPDGIIRGPDDNMWVTASSRLLMVTDCGAFADIDLGSSGDPRGLVMDETKAVWITNGITVGSQGEILRVVLA